MKSLIDYRQREGKAEELPELAFKHRAGQKAKQKAHRPAKIASIHTMIELWAGADWTSNGG